MAEGVLRALGGQRFESFSAGTEATQVRPLAVRAMAEINIDISDQQSKTLDRYLDQPFYAVISVCDQANEACPVFFGARKRLHWSFPDPSKAEGDQQQQLAMYRRVRDAIRARIERELLGSANREATAVREARPEDAGAITRIWNQGIEDRVATFQTAPRTLADVERQLVEREGRYPTVVVECGGEVVAWASAGMYHSPPWYEPIMEHSVYVDRAHRGTGMGRLALAGLCDEAERRGAFKLVSRIFVENEASRALHRQVGFREVGVYRRHGKLDGQWRDCVIVEKLLGEAAAQ
jgi:L-amino acid N-acyltransferase YncA/protein-tyrosine-phosphatase